MAAKQPAAKKAAKTAKAVKSSKTTKANTHYTAAQSQAYQAASKAAIQNAQTHANATALQQRRLQGATKARAKLAAKGVQLYGARIKKLAVSQTYKQAVASHQSKQLVNQAAHRLFKAQQVATNRQFAYSGEAIHARTTTLQTLTNAQALSASMRASAKARAKAITAASKRKPIVTHTRKAATSRSKYTAIGASAGRAAAASIPKSRKAAKGSTTGVCVDTEWITAGNDEDQENCINVAIANHLLYHTGIKVSDEQIGFLDAHYLSPRIDRALNRLDYYDLWHGISLEEYGMVGPKDAEPGMLIGFDVTVDEDKIPHCGVLMPGNQVVSWGEVIPLEYEIDEAWEIVWTKTSR